MGETIRSGYLRDDWRVTVGDRIAFADGFFLDGAIQDRRDRPAIARGGRALASALHVGANLDVMARNARKMRANRPFLFTNIEQGQDTEVLDFIDRNGGLCDSSGSIR